MEETGQSSEVFGGEDVMGHQKWGGFQQGTNSVLVTRSGNTN